MRAVKASLANLLGEMRNREGPDRLYAETADHNTQRDAQSSDALADGTASVRLPVGTVADLVLLESIAALEVPRGLERFNVRLLTNRVHEIPVADLCDVVDYTCRDVVAMPNFVNWVFAIGS